MTINATAHAHEPQEGKVFATFGPFLHQTQNLHSKDRSRAPLLVGLGLLAEGDTGPRGGIEVGLFYIEKTYQRIFGTTHIVEQVHKVDLPIGYRHWFSNEFSAALYFSALFSLGEYQVIYSDYPGGDVTSAREQLEYGAESSVQWEFWHNDLFAVLLDGRYFYSLSAQDNEDAHHYGIMVGLKYLIQEK